MYDVIIIGSGPAGLTAAVYCARAGLKLLVFAGMEYGGQLMSTTLVENFPGFPAGVQGPELMQNMLKQAENLHAEFVYKLADKVELQDAVKKVWCAGKEYQAKAVIVATGAYARKLGLPGEQQYWGKGVSACATCDGALYRGKEVAVVGGGDTAIEEASFITRFASKVYLIHRRDQLRASAVMQERAKANPNIEILWNKEVKDVLGDGGIVTGIKLWDNKANQESVLPVSGFFLGIGHIPNTDIFQGQLDLDDEGFIKVTDDTQTNISGVFVAGDVKDRKYRQAITAAGMGCMAALDCEKWLSARAS